MRQLLFRASLIVAAVAVIYVEGESHRDPGIGLAVAMSLFLIAIIWGLPENDFAVELRKMDESDAPAHCAGGPGRLCGAPEGMCRWPQCSPAQARGA